ncbi:MAG: septum formation initiator family protein [Bacteroidetes bacterium]|nr:septum formation initiator family protein [Bacteroidota bacterium]MCY4234504.1 septum formation initiator family protein [Bacteroidota bacterium]
MKHSESARAAPHSPRLLIVGGIIAAWLLLQFVWFDTYSWVRYQQWQQEYQELVHENERLETEIGELQNFLKTTPSDELIEKIAREQYGMRREGEIVYRVTD